MDPIKGVPLRNQGEPLPPDFPYQGQWIHKPRMFLYRPTNQQSLGGAEITAVVNEGSAEYSFGINAAQLGLELHTDIEAIFKHNAANTLYLVTAEDVAPTMGANLAKRYIFQIGDRQGSMTMEWGGPSGNA